MKMIVGTVISTKMRETVVVERTILQRHPLYKKTIRARRRLKAHTRMELVVGDEVKIKQVKPISKDTHYEVVEKTNQQT